MLVNASLLHQGRLRQASLLQNCCLCAGFSFAAALPAFAGEAVEGVSAGLGAGYAFRSQVDGRNHGAGARLFLDVPLPGPFALRPELLSLGFQGAAPAPDAADVAVRNPQSLGFVAGALSIVYSFDDSDLEALASVGPLAGVSLERSFAMHAGLLAGIGLRVPVAGAASLDVQVSSPVVIVGPKGITAPGQGGYADGTLVELPLQALFSLGLVVDVEALFAAEEAPHDEGGLGYDDAAP